MACAATAGAQIAPIVLPNTISTVAGGASSNCAAATDSYGDGCVATLAKLGANEWGVGTDTFGNIYFLDNTNAVVHKIDARSGLLSLAVSNSSAGTAACTTGKTSGVGDGCLAASQVSGLNPRNLSVDAYGNILIPDYGHGGMHIVCETVSPLCTSGQIGTMQIVAGYFSTTTATGSNVTGATAGTAGDGTLAISTVNTTGLSGPRGGYADIYGNVYIADTGNSRFRVVLGPQTYNSVTNPLWAVIQSDTTYATPHAGYIYPILGGFTGTPASGGYCSGSSGPTALDAIGDGCPFYKTIFGGTPGTSTLYGITADAYGDVLFADANSSDKEVRVLYMGGTQMANLIKIENPSVSTPVVGSVYVLAGGGGHSISTTPYLGTGNILTNPNSVAFDPSGNIYIGEDSANDVLFLDANTGYVRVLFARGTACSGTIGDGCPASQSTFGTGSYTLPIAFDSLGNLFLADQANTRIRKVSASSLIPMTVGTQAIQNIVVHEPVSAGAATAAALASASAGITVGSPSCTSNSDGTNDCTIPLTLNAATPGLRTGALLVTPTSGSAVTFPLAGLASGPALVTDALILSSTGSVTPSVNPVGANTPSGIALDGAGNLYQLGSNGAVSVYLAAALNTLATTASFGSAITQIAVDSQGNLYGVNGSSSISRIAALNTSPVTYSGTVTTITSPAPAQALVVDANANLYAAGSNGSIYKISQANPLLPIAYATGYTNPTLLALDNGGNLYVYDASASTIYKTPYLGTRTTFLSGVGATGLAVDAGLNVYVQTSSGINMYPASSPSTAIPVTSLLSSGADGIALDGAGNLYAAYSAISVLQIARSATSYNFGTTNGTGTYLTGTFTNAGNAATTAFTESPSNEFKFDAAGVGTFTCGATLPPGNALAAGGYCGFSLFFSPVGSTGGSTSAILTAGGSGTFTPSGTEPTTASTTYNTAITFNLSSSYSTVYGSTASYTATVSATGTSDVPSGTISVAISPSGCTLSGNGTYTLTSGQASFTVSGCPVLTGSTTAYTINVSYLRTADGQTANAFFGASTAAPTLTLTAATPTVSWSPTTTSLAYSTAIGTSASGVLNATASVPGVFVYTATTGSTVRNIHAASYLPLGSYTLGVTFYPTDATDYSSAAFTGTAPTLTVTQATTTAGFGSSQTVVASDGTGNYTSVQSAVTALGALGGSLYIKPGTYTGDVTVVQPNVSMYGLGGDPTQVILTHAGGAFGNGQNSNAYAGEFTSAQNNSSQLASGSSAYTGDEASATLVVAKGINATISGTTLTPSGFYADTLTLRNTYNTDSTSTTTYIPAGGNTCTAGNTTAYTYSQLYNATNSSSQPTECASQALAIWITSDQAVLNNVYTTSLQDTIYAGSVGSSGGVFTAARQYWFRGKVTGNVDFIFGDAAAAFDSTTIYAPYHASASGTVTIEAQAKANQTGSTNDYVSGYIMNNVVFTSQAAGMTGLYFGRPYVNSGSISYSTWVMLNSYVDQVTPAGYILGPNNIPLTQSTYLEYNDIPYTDPSATDINGVAYLGNGGSSGAGVTGTRESTSTNPGTVESGNVPPTSMTQAQAQAYFPTAFLSQTTGGLTAWIPTATLASKVNAFVGTGSSASVATAASITLLMRPQTPGLGAIPPTSYNAGSPTPTVFTVPTGTYTLSDTYNSTTSVIATGSLDASGEATYTTAALGAGTHSLSWVYSGDSNFAGSTSSAYTVTVSGTSPTAQLALSAAVTYGQSATVTETVTPASAQAIPTGTVSITVDGTTTLTATLVTNSTNGNAVATFTIPGLLAGNHTVTSNSFSAPSLTVPVAPAPLTIQAFCNARTYDAPNVCGATVSGYVYADTAGTVLSGTPTSTTTARRTAPPNTYTATLVSGSLGLTTFGAANYTEVANSGSFVVAGNAPQKITFARLPAFPGNGSYQLTASASSGLPVTYTVTGAGASISGSTLILSGSSGVTITVTAAQHDSTGTYLDAPTSTRSFVAQ